MSTILKLENLNYGYEDGGFRRQILKDLSYEFEKGQFYTILGPSGSGKTTAACALLAALQARGEYPCAFKSGPDYIDPMFHRAVLGVVLLNVQNNYNFISSVVYGITGGLGFLLAIVLFASIRERLVFADYPKAFEGFPIALVTAGLMALAFMGFSGLKVW